MKICTNWKHAFVMLIAALALSACSDDSTQRSAENTPTAPVTEHTIQADQFSSQIIECDQYFSAMQACKVAQMSEEDAQKLDQALLDLKQYITQIEDKGQLQQLCQQALDQIDEQKAAIGCV